MKNIEKAKVEIEKWFPNDVVEVGASSISLFVGTLYHTDRRELERIEKKYKANSWLDSYNDQLRWHMHNIYEPPEPEYAEYLIDDDEWEKSFSTVEQVKQYAKGSTTTKYRYFSNIGLTYRIKNTE